MWSHLTPGFLCVTQALGVSTDKSSWGKLVTHRRLSMSKAWTPIPRSLLVLYQLCETWAVFSSPWCYYWVPIDVTAGWAASLVKQLNRVYARTHASTHIHTHTQIHTLALWAHLFTAESMSKLLIKYASMAILSNKIPSWLD